MKKLTHLISAACLSVIAVQGFGQNTNTTYGGVPRDGGGANPGRWVPTPAGTGNTGFGTFALGPTASTVLTGIQNTGIGYETMYTGKTGSFNTAGGYTSLYSNNAGNYNTAEGWKAMYSNTSGIWNTVVGANAMINNQSGNFNTAVGASALLNNVTSMNTAFGFEAAYSDSKGDSNNAVGVNTLLSNVNGNANVAEGFEALFNTTASDNTAVGAAASFTNGQAIQTTAVGYQALYNNVVNYTTGLGAMALYSNTKGAENTAVGYESFMTNVLGNCNTGVGYNSGASISSGDSNCVIGTSALTNNNSGSSNTAIGAMALYNGLTSFNTAVGNSALFNSAKGEWNASVGYRSMYNNQDGNNNAALGQRALYTNVLGSYDVAIGSGADVAGINLTNSSAIGANAIVTTNNSMILGNNQVFVGIGLSNNAAGPQNRLEISYYAAGSPLPCGPPPASTFAAPSCGATPTGSSGLRFHDLTYASTPYPNNPNSGFLTVDDDGNVVLMQGGGGPGGTGIGYCLSGGLTTMSDDGGYNMNFHNFYFEGNQTQFLKQNDVIIGNGCSYVPKGKLDVLQNSGWSNGNSVGIYLENDDFGGCVSPGGPIIGIESYLPAQLTSTQISNKIAGWFEADSTQNCCGTYNQYAILVPQHGGNVEIGVQIPASGVPCANTYLLDVYGSGTLSASYTTSDSNLKTAITPLKKQGDALSIIERLKGVSYNYKKAVISDSGMAGTHYGFIAQQVAQVLPNVVKTDGHGREGVAYTEIIPFLVEGMKEQQHTIDSLTSTLQNIQACLNQICSATGNNNLNNNGNTTTQVQDVTLSGNGDAPLLYQNIPNPFSTSTKINYYLPEGTQGATIVFYDNYGNKMKEVQLGQTGNATLNLNPENLSNGVYSYSLVVNGKVVDTKRMILQK